MLITGHQAFFTDEPLRHIADTTLANITAVERGQAQQANLVTAASGR